MIGILIWQLAVMVIPIGNDVVIISIAATVGMYLYYGVYKKYIVKAFTYNWYLTAFIIAGGVWCVLSVLGLADWANLTRNFEVDLSFLPRQAYYFFFLPLIALAPFLKIGKAFDFIEKHNIEIAIGLYLILCIENAGIYALDIVAYFAIAFLSLLGNRKRKLDWVVAIGLIVVPLPEAGNSTIILLKVIYLGLFVFKNAKWVMKLATLTIPLMIIVSFVFPQFTQTIENLEDPNAKWRLQYWEDCTSAIIDTYGIGIGYGTTYASKEFTEPQSVRPPYDTILQKRDERPFSANDIYTKEQRPFVTAPHNSFVAITFRMGVVGLVLFCGFLFLLWKKIYFKRDKRQVGLTFLFCGTMLIISLNVGLESPRYLQTFITAMCIISALTSQEEQISKGETDEMLGSYSVV